MQSLLDKITIILASAVIMGYAYNQQDTVVFWGWAIVIVLNIAQICVEEFS